MPLFSWQRTTPYLRIRTRFAENRRPHWEKERMTQFKLSWIILAISDLYGSENATVFPQPITTRFPPPDNGLLNAPPIYHSVKFYKWCANLVALRFRFIDSFFPQIAFTLLSFTISFWWQIRTLYLFRYKNNVAMNRLAWIKPTCYLKYYVYWIIYSLKTATVCTVHCAIKNVLHRFMYFLFNFLLHNILIAGLFGN